MQTHQQPSNEQSQQAINQQQKSQESGKNHNHNGHKQHAHDQLDSDCEGCQAQKKENQKLVEFYQRLDKMNNKVKKIRHTNNETSMKGNQMLGQEVNPQKINHSKLPQLQTANQLITPQYLKAKINQLNQRLNVEQLPSTNQIKDFSHKEIGFELAAALIERQMKYKNENKKLQQKINQLLAQKKKKEESQKLMWSQYSNSQKMDESMRSMQNLQELPKQEIIDSLDNLKQNKKPKIKKNQSASFWDIDSHSTNTHTHHETTFFQTKNKPSSNPSKSIHNTNFSKNQENGPLSVKKQKNPYNTEQGYGLNLWLYQFKTQDYDEKMKSSWIGQNSTKASQKDRYNASNSKNLNESLNTKTPRQSSINKTSIIQKNILSDYHVPLQNKKKPY